MILGLRIPLFQVPFHPVCIETADGGHSDGDQTFTLICKVSPRLVGSYSFVCELCEC